MSSDQLPSADVLRNSLTALSLPIWGTREQMWERLKNGGEKKKPGPKPGNKNNKDTSGDGTLSTASFFEPGELKFYNAERPKLLALGISDQIKLTTELKRRWEESKAKTTSKKETEGGSGQTFMSDTVISAVDMASAGLKLVGVDSSSGCNKYIYEIVGKNTSVAKNTSGSAGASSATKKKKRKEESSDDDSSDDHDSDMDRCEVIVAQRLRKMPKTLLKESLKVYKDKTTGTKKELAERLAENVTNETGSEDSGSDSE